MLSLEATLELSSDAGWQQVQEIIAGHFQQSLFLKAAVCECAKDTFRFLLGYFFAL